MVKIRSSIQPDRKSPGPGPRRTHSRTPKSTLPAHFQLLEKVQQNFGNQAVGRMLQAKMKIGQPGDKFEREADQVAEQVMRMPEPQGQGRLEEDDEVRRQPDEEEGETLQAKRASNTTPPVPPKLASNIRALRGGGQPLPRFVRNFFEPRLGVNFSGVRVHTGIHAAQTARSINARAFTVGNNIAFDSGQYAPETDSGKKLLAHELTHVVRQRNRTLIRRKPGLRNSNRSGAVKPYIPGKMSRLYHELPAGERAHIAEVVDRRFELETGVRRQLNWNDPKDRPLARRWLRMRDKIMRVHKSVKKLEKKVKKLVLQNKHSEAVLAIMKAYGIKKEHHVIKIVPGLKSKVIGEKIDVWGSVTGDRKKGAQQTISFRKELFEISNGDFKQGFVYIVRVVGHEFQHVKHFTRKNPIEEDQTPESEFLAYYWEVFDTTLPAFSLEEAAVKAQKALDEYNLHHWDWVDKRTRKEYEAKKEDLLRVIFKARMATVKGFKDSLAKEFSKHGAEFGAKSAEEYLDKAKRFVLKKEEDLYECKVRDSGIKYIKYDEDTNTLVIFEFFDGGKSIIIAFSKPPNRKDGYFQACGLDD